jgi:hypothetical protein
MAGVIALDGFQGDLFSTTLVLVVLVLVLVL